MKLLKSGKGLAMLVVIATMGFLAVQAEAALIGNSDLTGLTGVDYWEPTDDFEDPKWDNNTNELYDSPYTSKRTGRHISNRYYASRDDDNA